jgi:hypothetical protein
MGLAGGKCCSAFSRAATKAGAVGWRGATGHRPGSLNGPAVGVGGYAYRVAYEGGVRQGVGRTSARWADLVQERCSQVRAAPFDEISATL